MKTKSMKKLNPKPSKKNKQWKFLLNQILFLNKKNPKQKFKNNKIKQINPKKLNVYKRTNIYIIKIKQILKNHNTMTKINTRPRQRQRKN